MEKKNILLSNANTRIAYNAGITEHLDFDLNDELEIVNDSDIPNLVKVEYVTGSYNERILVTCGVCNGKEQDGSKTFGQKIKVLGLKNINGYFSIEIKSIQDKVIYAAIIEKMRQKFHHGQQVCGVCVENIEDEAQDTSGMEENFEEILALSDINKHYNNLAQLENIDRPYFRSAL